MSYQVKSKIKGQVYVYEVESYWDKEKKFSRQKRKLIGKVDPKTQEIIPTRSAKRSEIKSSYDYGTVYFLSELIKQANLVKILQEIFPELYNYILYLSLFRVASDDAMYLYEDWSEANYLSKSYQMSSQKISEAMKELSNQEVNMEKFFKLWTEQNKSSQGVMFDITSFSSYSKEIDLFEYGYNRDKEILEQINLGLVIDSKNGTPLFYKIYPGSISDVKTLRNINKFAQDYGLNMVLFVLDRGFYSKHNLLELLKDKQDFILSVPFNNNQAKALIEQNNDLESGKNCFRISNQVYFYKTEQIKVDDYKLNATIYFNQEIKAAEIKRFICTLEDYEFLFASKKFNNSDDAQDFLKENCKSYAKYFEIKDKKLVRIAEAIENKFKFFGKFILLSSKNNISAIEQLQLYKDKDRIEKTFYSIKHEFASKRLRVKSEDTLKGKMFLLFISSIIKSHIHSVMKKENLYKNFTFRQVIAQLQKIKIYKLQSGISIISEVSKKQSDIFEKFGIEISSEKPSVNFSGF